jgi:hypothetical protein
VILDEAHATTGRTWKKLAGLKWIATLSANVVSPILDSYSVWRGVRDQGSSWTVAAGVMAGVVPTARPRQITVAPWRDEDRQFGNGAEKKTNLGQNIDAYVSALTGLFAELSGGRVVLYLPDGDASEAIIDAAPQFATDWRVIKFINAVSRIWQFETLNRAILVAHHAKTVAINIHATHLIVVRPDWINPVRYAQLIGRVLRPLSPTATIDAFLIMPRGIPSIRVAFAEAVRVLIVAGLHPPLPEFGALDYLKADACLRACGSTAVGSSPIELLAAMGVGVCDPACAEKLLAHWLTNPAKTLTETSLRCLLGLEPAGLSSADLDGLLEEFL